MLFKARFHDGLRDGSVDRSYRRWKTPKVKVGGCYRFAPTDAIEVTRIEALRAGALTRNGARRSGFASVAELRREIEKASRDPLGDSDELTCVYFRYSALEAKPKPPKKVDRVEVSEMVDRIEAMERRSRTGPWVWKTLDLIAENPRRRAGDLADILGAERRPFKSRVRRLKGLGLTESFEIGYDLSSLGRAVLNQQRALKEKRPPTA